MSYFYLDGYNLLFSLMEAKRSLKAQRHQFICFLQHQFALCRLKGTLVFDGTHKREEESGISYRSPLEIVYAPKGSTADAYIVERVEREPHRKQVVVVTNDQGLKREVRSLGATVLGNASFIQWLKKRRKKRGDKREVVETKKNIDRLLAIFEKRFEEGVD